VNTIHVKTIVQEQESVIKENATVTKASQAKTALLECVREIALETDNAIKESACAKKALQVNTAKRPK